MAALTARRRGLASHCQQKECGPGSALLAFMPTAARNRCRRAIPPSSAPLTWELTARSPGCRLGRLRLQSRGYRRRDRKIAAAHGVNGHMDSRDPETGTGEILAGLAADCCWPPAPHGGSAVPASDIGSLARAVKASSLSFPELSMLAVDPETRQRLSPRWLAELAAGQLPGPPQAWQIRALVSAIGARVDPRPGQGAYQVARLRICADEWLLACLPPGVSGEDRRRVQQRAVRFAREHSPATTGDAGPKQCECLRADLHEVDGLLGPVMLHRRPGRTAIYCAANQIAEDLAQVLSTMTAKLSQATLQLPSAAADHAIRIIRVAPDVMPEPLHPAVGMVAARASVTWVRADLMTAGLAATLEDVCVAQTGYLLRLPGFTLGGGGVSSGV